MNSELAQRLKEAIDSLVKEHVIATEELTKQQLAEVIKQALESGDFLQHVNIQGGQVISYAPFREMDAWRKRRRALLDKIVALFEEEMEHNP